VSAQHAPVQGLSLTDPRCAEVLNALPGLSPQQHTPTQAERDLDTTQCSVDAVRTHLRILTQRFGQLQRMPGGRTDLSVEQRIEYDLIGAALVDARAAIAKAQEGGAA